MDWNHVVVLAVLQGLTEFLPISSSAHLILLPLLEDWPDQGVAFDVALHVGTLLAVLIYFHAEITRILRDWLRSLAERRRVGESDMAWYLAVGTIPVGIGGLVVTAIGSEMLRSSAVIAGATIVFALLLWWSDIQGRHSRSDTAIGWRDVAVIGFAQALALIPGTSRSGITMTAGLALGLTRQAAARFSFLLSIPVIILAGGLEAVESFSSKGPVPWGAMFVGALLAFVCAYTTIHFFLKLVERIGLLPFVIYRLVLGAALFAFVV